ncbi:MAG: phosphotransferase [Gemmatimonadaceae bacterium]|nr:phosphotransferase [Gemmatimonadaceae bacterium]
MTENSLALDTEPQTAPFATFPDAIRAPANDAIRHAFPDGVLQSVDRVNNGMSGALVYRLRVDDRALVLRIPQPGSSSRDVHRQLLCMQVAAGSDVAPPVFYANADTGVSLSAFVAPPVRPVPRDAAQLGQLLRALHGGPPFPVHRTAFEAIDGAVIHLAQSGIVLPSLLQEVLAAYEQIKRVITPHLTLAPCHNDLNPGNVLQDGTRQWLVDWDSACMNDPMFDVASTIHWFRLDDSRERDLLRAYFDRTPAAHELAKLELMKQVAWCYYMLVFLLISLPDGGVGAMHAVDRDRLMSFADFVDGIGRGEQHLHQADTRRHLSLVLGHSALKAMRRKEFTEALARLSS